MNKKALVYSVKDIIFINDASSSQRKVRPLKLKGRPEVSLFDVNRYIYVFKEQACICLTKYYLKSYWYLNYKSFLFEFKSRNDKLKVHTTYILNKFLCILRQLFIHHTYFYKA